jgi:hypothetical protein
MPVYDIYRKYRIKTDNPTQAMKKLFDAVDAKKDEDYHISDSIRESDEPANNGKVADWATSAKRQLLGK